MPDVRDLLERIREGQGRSGIGGRFHDRDALHVSHVGCVFDLRCGRAARVCSELTGIGQRLCSAHCVVGQVHPCGRRARNRERVGQELATLCVEVCRDRRVVVGAGGVYGVDGGRVCDFACGQALGKGSGALDGVILVKRHQCPRRPACLGYEPGGRFRAVEAAHRIVVHRRGATNDVEQCQRVL